MGIDPFDEFEFKPLTEGLGFHKKAEKIKSEMKSAQIAQDKVARSVPEAPPRSLFFQNDSLSEPLLDSRLSDGRLNDESSKSASQSISDLIASLPPSLDFLDAKEEKVLEKPSSAANSFDSSSLTSSKSSLLVKTLEEDNHERPQIFQPLARQEYISPAGPTIGQALGRQTLNSATIPAPVVQQPSHSPYRERLDESFAKAFPHAEKTRKRSDEISTSKKRAQEKILEGGLEQISGNAVSAILDGMVIAGVATILMVAILAITKVNLVGLLGNAQTDGPTQLHLALLFIAVLQIYFLTARSFFGSSLGEWAFDIQLGTDEDQARAVYPLRVAWRILVLTATGFVLIPVLSMIFRRDLLKPITGLQLYRRN